MNKLTKDHVGGGAAARGRRGRGLAGVGYGIGTLRQMGSGFFPVVLGVLLVLVGVAMLATTRARARRTPARGRRRRAEMAHLAGPVVQWRGWLCILGGVLAFVVLGEHGGLVPATFVVGLHRGAGRPREHACATPRCWRVAMTVVGVVVFHSGCSCSLPLFAWG